MVNAFEQFISIHPDVQFLYYRYVDLFGILRTRVLTISHVRHLESTKEALNVGPAALYCTYVNEPRELRPSRAAKSAIIPDWTSLRLCSAHNGTRASVMRFVREGVDNMLHRRCPRTLVRRQVDTAKASNNLDLLVGFELEFKLLKRAETELGYSIIDTPAGASSAAALRGPVSDVLEDMCLVLLNAGISVQQYHAETPQGLFEIDTAPLPPLQALDALVTSVEIVKEVATKHGLKATFFPDFVKANAGQHVHISISDAKLSAPFLAGILEHARALCAFSLPNVDSYGRVGDRLGTNGSWVSWGREMRDVPVREITSTHWEIRCVDGTANMYLVVAAIIQAGLLGITSNATLGIQNAAQSPSAMSDTDLLGHGITQRLPQSLGAALDALKDDATLTSALGTDLCEKYLWHKTVERDVQSAVPKAERVKMCIQHF